MGMFDLDQDPNRENSTVSNVSIQAFLCPSDSAGPPNAGFSGNNYCTNGGNLMSDACEQFPSSVGEGMPRGPMYNR